MVQDRTGTPPAGLGAWSANPGASPVLTIEVAPPHVRRSRRRRLLLTLAGCAALLATLAVGLVVARDAVYWLHDAVWLPFAGHAWHRFFPWALVLWVPLATLAVLLAIDVYTGTSLLRLGQRWIIRLTLDHAPAVAVRLHALTRAVGGSTLYIERLADSRHSDATEALLDRLSSPGPAPRAELLALSRALRVGLALAPYRRDPISFEEALAREVGAAALLVACGAGFDSAFGLLARQLAERADRWSRGAGPAAPLLTRAVGDLVRLLESRTALGITGAPLTASDGPEARLAAAASIEQWAAAIEGGSGGWASGRRVPAAAVSDAPHGMLVLGLAAELVVAQWIGANAANAPLHACRRFAAARALAGPDVRPDLVRVALAAAAAERLVHSRQLAARHWADHAGKPTDAAGAMAGLFTPEELAFTTRRPRGVGLAGLATGSKGVAPLAAPSEHSSSHPGQGSDPSGRVDARPACSGDREGESA